MENDIAARVRLRLLELGKSAASASLEAGLGRSAIQDILSGRVGNPRFDTLVKLAEALDCSVNYLVGSDDHPHAEADKSTRGEPTLIDVYFEPVEGILAAGVFRESGDDTTADTEESTQRFVVYRDRRANESAVEIWKQDDNSLAGIGILKGDILTASDLDMDEIALKPGRIVIVKRVLGLEGPLEMSARVVEVSQGELRLVSKPSSGTLKPIIISSKRAKDGEEEYNPNFYWASEDNSDWVHIEALVLRVTRDVSLID